MERWIGKAKAHGGIRKIKGQQIDSIGLTFTFCPDRYSIFPVENSNNYFAFEFEPWIAEVFFANFALKYSNNNLIGEHLLLQENEYTYVKE
jgi:hypothetical protein